MKVRLRSALRHGTEAARADSCASTVTGRDSAPYGPILPAASQATDQISARTNTLVNPGRQPKVTMISVSPGASAILATAAPEVYQAVGSPRRSLGYQEYSEVTASGFAGPS